MAPVSLNRLLRGRIHAAVAWAMVPLAVLNGRTVLGCMSPSGHYDPSCRCWAGSGDHQDSGTARPCHCGHCLRQDDADRSSCPHCKQKTACHANHPSRVVQGSRMQGAEHCRAVGMYQQVSAVPASPQAGSDHDPSAAFVFDAIDLPNSSPTSVARQVIERDTGPPPDNLCITLHRLVI